jgi:hypothetical protein
MLIGLANGRQGPLLIRSITCVLRIPLRSLLRLKYFRQILRLCRLVRIFVPVPHLMKAKSKRTSLAAPRRTGRKIVLKATGPAAAPSPNLVAISTPTRASTPVPQPTATPLSTAVRCPSRPHSEMCSPLSASTAVVTIGETASGDVSYDSSALSKSTQDIRCIGRWLRCMEAKLAERPLILSGWQTELVDDLDRDFLSHMVEHGLSFDIDEHTVLKPFDCKNYTSAFTNATMVREALAPDLEAGRLFEPPINITSSYIHAIGAVPKTAHFVQVIHDHSRLYGFALNESLSQTSFSFASVDNAIKLMRPDSYMANVDIEAVYRHVPIDPADSDKLAFW